MKITKKHISKMESIIKKEFDILIKRLNKDWTHSQSNCFSRVQQTISYGIKGECWLVLGSLSHELGHCLLVRQNRSVVGMALMIQYKLGFPLNKKESKRILDEERLAWRLGFAFLKKNGIVIDDDMRYMRKVCINSHVKKLKSTSS